MASTVASTMAESSHRAKLMSHLLLKVGSGVWVVVAIQIQR